MTVRNIFLTVCAAILLSSVPSLLAQPDAPGVCCFDSENCDGQKCCAWEELGINPCSEEQQGWCMTACIRPSGGQQ